MRGGQFTGSDAILLQRLLSAAHPFLRITGADRVAWCRPMKDPKNGRVGPWKFKARVEVLDQQVWDRSGEVLYFVTDAKGALRLGKV